MPEMGQTISHYRIMDKIGQCGMGEVYLADDTTLDRKVALKFLPEAFTSDPERMARFEREAKLLASLNHPNIAGIHGLEQADGNRFLVLEYVEGETLQARLSKGILPLEDALELRRQIAEGLEAAHEKGVIHRDLKPANVMITAEERVKILDFGLAKALADETQSIDSSQSPTLTEAMTRPGVILGTAAYMSPEQAKGKSVNKRADIWAFGCILYECLTGKKAFEGETVTETLAAVIRGEPDFEKAPPKARLLLQQCLVKDRKNRLRDIGDAMAWIKPAPETAPKPVPLKHSWFWKTVPIVFFIIIIVLTFFLFRHEEPSMSEPMRFQIELPDEVTISPSGRFYLSPDGRKLAFASIDADGKQLLWLRPLDSTEARPLNGTESTTRDPFFWSPDSRFIVFDAGGKLKKIDISSGAISPICNISGLAVGGAWNRDDTIIYSDYNASNGIMKVSAGGGNPTPVTRPNKNRQERRHLCPMFLPDGRHFVYFCQSDIPENEGMYIGSLDMKPEEQETKQVLMTSSLAAYIPPKGTIPGQLLFVSDQTLMAQAFDEEGLERIGDPISIVGNVGGYLNGGFFTASVNGILVYRSGLDFPLSQLTWVDRQGENHGLVGEPGNYNGLTISPDGNYAAVSLKTTPTSPVDIWIFNLLRSDERILTTGLGSSYFPIWSPKGNYILCGGSRGHIVDLYEKAVGIEQEKRLFESGENKFPTSCSIDGSFVLYMAEKGKTGYDLYVYSFEKDEGIPVLCGDANEIDGQFSPDMQWVAYVSNETGSYEVYVIPFTRDFGETLSSAGSVSGVSTDGGMGPRWSKDGRELYYQTLDGKVIAVTFTVTDDKTFRVKDSRTLFQKNIDVETVLAAIPLPAWDVSRDGNQFLLPLSPSEGSAEPFNVILNWTSLLKQ